MDKYFLERDGQLDFYNVFLPRVNPSLDIDEILADNNDGVINGNLLEFKLHVTDLNAVLFQCVKYLSALRVKGKPVPANILIIDVNSETVWLYHSAPYLTAIEKLYTGGASKDNSGFIGGNAERILHYDKPLDAERLVSLLKECNFTKIHIDENCVVGWATSFYKAKPTARKEDFLGDDTGKHKTIGEIRKPSVFADYIYPYTGATNVKFNYLMDKLNDSLLKKNLGAFYTPPAYAKKSLELVRMAIARVPVGNDYIILDRCAGTGNLESYMNDEELSHCIVSTVEYYEYKVLQELLGAKVRHIIPPVETAETFNAGLVTGADALSKEYVENPVIKQYVDNPKCTIILFENPPYAETTSAEHQRQNVGKKSSSWKNSFVVETMKEAIRGKVKGSPSNDMGNAFIWSAFKYYLRQPTDSYIVYSPVKYWKAQHLVNKQFVKGFAFNRRYFHTNIDACIMCALWANIDESTTELSLIGYDIVGDKLSQLAKPLPVKRIQNVYSAVYYDKRPIPDECRHGILAALNGIEKVGGKQRNKPATSDDILGYMVAHSSGFDNPDLDSSLLVAGRYDGNGFYLRKDNYLEKLPMFAASRYITYNREWTERARIMKSADGADKFAKDVANGKLKQFLLKCLLFTCTEMQNHMRTFTGSGGASVTDGAINLLTSKTTGHTVTKSLENDISDSKKVSVEFDWRNNAASGKGNGSWFALHDSNDNMIFALYGNGKYVGIGASTTDTSSGWQTIEEFSNDWYKVALELDFEAKTISGTITNVDDNKIVKTYTNEPIQNSASNLGKLYAQDGYSDAVISLDNVYIKALPVTSIEPDEPEETETFINTDFSAVDGEDTAWGFVNSNSSFSSAGIDTEQGQLLLTQWSEGSTRGVYQHKEFSDEIAALKKFEITFEYKNGTENSTGSKGKGYNSGLLLTDSSDNILFAINGGSNKADNKKILYGTNGTLATELEAASSNGYPGYTLNIIETNDNSFYKVQLTADLTKLTDNLTIKITKRQSDGSYSEESLVNTTVTTTAVNLAKMYAINYNDGVAPQKLDSFRIDGAVTQ